MLLLLLWSLGFKEGSLLTRLPSSSTATVTGGADSVSSRRQRPAKGDQSRRDPVESG